MFRKILPLLLVLFVTGFSVWFIVEKSFIAADGQRYYTVADDALISFRYGWNLAEGNGLVWNVGERVEGITNTLWTLLSALVSLVLSKRLLPLAMLGWGVVFLLLASWGTQRILLLLLRDTASRSYKTCLMAAAFLLPVSYFPLMFWSLRGMETSLLACLLTWSIYAFLRDSHRRSWQGAVLLGLALLTRPDTMVPALLLFTYRLYLVLSKRLALRALLQEVALFGLFVVGSTCFRYFYYGALVPNTYILKATGLTLLERIRLNGINYIGPFLWITWPLYLLVGLSLVLRPTVKKILLVVLPLAMTAYTVYIGGDGLAYWRYIAPTMPLLFLVVLSDFPVLVDVLPRRKLQRVVSVSLALGLLFWVGCMPYAEYFEPKPQPDDVANINKAIYLNQVLSPGASVGVMYAGAIPYYTGLRAVDFLGKCDSYIAHLPPDKEGPFTLWLQKSPPGHNKYDLHYSVLKLKPTYVSGLTIGPQDISEEGLKTYWSIPVRLNPSSSGPVKKMLLQKSSPHIDWKKVIDRYQAEKKEQGGTLLMHEQEERSVQCPYCGEGLTLLIDASVPHQNYIEDCQVCCQPIQFDVTVTQDDEVSVVVSREGE